MANLLVAVLPSRWQPPVRAAKLVEQRSAQSLVANRVAAQKAVAKKGGGEKGGGKGSTGLTSK